MTSEDEGDYNEINNNVAINNNNNKNAIVNKSNTNNETSAKPQQQIAVGNRYGQLRWVSE